MACAPYKPKISSVVVIQVKVGLSITRSYTALCALSHASIVSEITNKVVAPLTASVHLIDSLSSLLNVEQYVGAGTLGVGAAIGLAASAVIAIVPLSIVEVLNFANVVTAI